MLWEHVVGVQIPLPRPFLIKEQSMTCKGYDPKAVKISKAVKRRAATIRDDHQRGAFIRSFVEIARSNSRTISRKDNEK